MGFLFVSRYDSSSVSFGCKRINDANNKRIGQKASGGTFFANTIKCDRTRVSKLVKIALRRMFARGNE